MIYSIFFSHYKNWFYISIFISIKNNFCLALIDFILRTCDPNKKLQKKNSRNNNMKIIY